MLLQGDWNCDWLPVLQSDPHAGHGREAKHQDQRMHLLAWCEAHGLQLVLPAACVAPHPEHEATLMCPISKVNASGNECSLLDYTFATPGIVKESWFMWRELHSDHAILVNTIDITENSIKK